MKKPRKYKKGKWQQADCSDAFKAWGKTYPKCVYVSCEEMTAKDARKLAAWLINAAKWMENK